MKKSVKLLLVLLISVIFVTTIANAETFKKQIKVANGVVKKIIIDGVDKTPKDNLPFIYEGTTYVPLRYISEELGKKVTWDGKTGTIFIGEEQDENKFFYKKPIAKVTKDIKTREDIKGISLYAQGVYGLPHWQDENGNEIYFRKESIIYTLPSETKSVSGIISMLDDIPSYFRKYDFTDDDKRVNGKIKIYDENDNVLYESERVRLMSDPIDFEISTKNVQKIRFELILEWNNTYNGIGTIAIKNLRYKY